MFIASQTAAYISPTSPTRILRLHKDTEQHTKTKHRYHHDRSSPNGEGGGKGTLPLLNKAAKKQGNKMDHLMISSSLLMPGNYCRSHSQLDAIMSPRKATMGPLLFRKSTSADILQVSHEQYREPVGFYVPVQVSTKKQSKKTKETAEVYKPTPDRPGCGVANTIRVAVLRQQAEKKTTKHDSLKTLCNTNHLQAFADAALHKSSSLPAISPTKEKEFQTIYSDNTGGNIFDQDNIDIHASPTFSFAVSDDIDVNNNNTRLKARSTSLGFDVAGNSKSNALDREVHSSSYNHACYVDRIIPLHAGSIFRKNPSMHASEMSRIKKKNASEIREADAKNNIEKSQTDDERIIKDNLSYAYGKGLANGTVNKQSTFNINLGKEDSWSDIKIEVLGPRIVPPIFAFEQIGEKACRVSYIPEMAGTHKISIRNKGKHIHESPFQFNIMFDNKSVWQQRV
eukprot:gene17495-19245_t